MKTLQLIIQSHPYERDIETSKFTVTYFRSDPMSNIEKKQLLKIYKRKKKENRYPIIKIEVI